MAIDEESLSATSDWIDMPSKRELRQCLKLDVFYQRLFARVEQLLTAGHYIKRDESAEVWRLHCEGGGVIASGNTLHELCINILEGNDS